MASKPLRPCKHPGCPELTREGWCSKHKPKHQRRDSGAYHGWYLLPIWTKRLRPEQLAQRYTPQTASRIEGEYQILPFTGQDIRKLKKMR